MKKLFGFKRFINYALAFLMVFTSIAWNGLCVEATTPADDGNLILNGDFEILEGENGFLHWTEVFDRNHVDTENVYDGNYALNVLSKDHIVYQLLEVEEGATYKLSGYVRIGTDARVGYTGYNKDEVNTQYQTFTKETRFSYYGTESDKLELTLEGDELVKGEWIKFSCEVTVPEGTTYLRVFLRGQTGYSRFDNISFRKVVDVTGITLDKTELALAVGDEKTLTATIAPEDATDKTVTWTTTSDAVATVDENGKVTAVGVGEATITATSNANNTFSARCDVTVTAAQTYVAQIEGGEKYETLQAAIDAAAEGAVIMLLDDVTESSIELKNKITLDLNGNILTATYFNAINGTNVVDSSKSGRLKVDAANGKLSKTNRQVPIYIDGEGYMFATMKGQSSVSKTDDSFTVISRPSFGDAYSNLAGGADAAKLKFIIRLDWGNDGNGGFTDNQEFEYSNNIVQTVYGSGKAFSVTVNGLTGYTENMKVTVLVRSTDLEVEWVNNEFYMSSAN